MKLGKKNSVLISLMLFSLFFGAGNLIFPPLLGQQSGTSSALAFIGFFITAVILPILGVIVVGKFGGLTVLSGKEITVEYDEPRPLQIDGETFINVKKHTVKI